ncbi:MAG: hypothetical protein IPK07_18255 [Deltaproteobacteria bacterium]|nr:hypothetical protein [Deltaproteobacteria bacterium]
MILRKTFGSASDYLPKLAGISFWSMVSSEDLKHRAWVRGREQVSNLLRTAAEELEVFGTVEPEVNALQVVERLCDRYHIAARQLRDRYGKRPTLDVTDEYDVQDLLHALLRLHFDDVRKEEYVPSYAGRNTRADFLLKAEQLIVECKKTRAGLGAAEVGGQLIEDIARYQGHPDCRVLVCFVYDPEGLIGNPRGIETDLSRQADGITVRVLICP